MGGVGLGTSPGPLTAVAVPESASVASPTSEVSGIPDVPRLDAVLTIPETWETPPATLPVRSAT
ncbi:Uncharacterised protein [Mycobacteroides abscessus subsp. abscessus]|nr:Uncharacterised protein [Mycobacteroides abscessus subsp. abscessus]SKP74161.1 Uncharacterised protein [Mycobacteroides abscessus subsp. abscessus]SKZ34461.1 Uncharacterised protein [Mycobacteroides abscessus subsp. abscessus]SLH12558.1 Uncharacterised protein [Mycobacteroides abscessus subsp. abscessus]SLI48640.1 Uncharacterised protein [Mycobacteroides abscessus subsp. abscessus]